MNLIIHTVGYILMLLVQRPFRVWSIAHVLIPFEGLWIPNVTEQNKLVPIWKKDTIGYNKAVRLCNPISGNDLTFVE